MIRSKLARGALAARPLSVRAVVRTPAVASVAAVRLASTAAIRRRPAPFAVGASALVPARLTPVVTVRQTRGVSTEALGARIDELWKQYKDASPDQIMHWTNNALAVLTPAAIILSPSFLNFPVDLALNVVIPVHTQIGMGTVLTDYVPRPFQTVSLFALGFVTFLIALGLLKINLCGVGITESVKSLWRSPERKKEEKSSTTKAIAGKVEAAKNKVSSTVESAKDKVSSTVESAKGKVSSTVEAAKDKAAEAKSKVSAVVDQAKDKAIEAKEEIKHALSDDDDEEEEVVVKKHPKKHAHPKKVKKVVVEEEEDEE